MCKASIDFKQYQNAFLPKFVVTIKCQKQKIGGKTILLVSIIKMTYMGICTLCTGSINCMSVITFGLITHNYPQFDLN